MNGTTRSTTRGTTRGTSPVVDRSVQRHAIDLGHRLNRVLHLCAALSIAAYTLAAEQPELTLIALGLLALEYAFVSRVGGRPLPRPLINAGIVLATAAVIYEMLAGGEDREFVSIVGRYVVWLSLIKLAEPKTTRNIGQALALTAMLAVGAVLTNVALIVGLLILAFIPVLLTGLVLFQLHAGHDRVAGSTLADGPAGPAQWRRDRIDGSRATTAAPDRVEAAVAGRWRRRPGTPLLAEPRFLRGLRAATIAHTAAIIVGSVGLFVVLPRGVGDSFLGSPGGPAGPRRSESGFTPDLQLGGLGVISESQAIALTVRLVRDDEAIGSPEVAWYLRGYAMDRYNASSGRWVRSDTSDLLEHRLLPDPLPPQDPSPRPGDIVQHITVRDHASTYLFSVFRPVRVDGPDGQRPLKLQIDADGVIRLPRASRGLFDYTITSRTELRLTRSATADDQPTREPHAEPTTHEPPAEPAPEPAAAADQDTGLPDLPDRDRPRTGATEEAWQFQTGPIAALARTIAEQTGIDPDPGQLRSREQALALVRAIEDHLGERCAYTLEQPPLRADDDPIEAFLFRTRRGHCEYFASASAALASALRLPSRVVTGYHATEWDAAAKQYIVRQSNAHAWAEVLIAPGEWVVLDPSAEEVRLLNRPRRGLLAGLRSMIDELEFMWIRRVVSYDNAAQKDLLNYEGSALHRWMSRTNQRLERAAGNRAPANETDAEPADNPAPFTIALLIVAGGTGVGLACVLAQRVLAWMSRRSLREPVHAGMDPAMRRRLAFYDEALRRLDRMNAAKPAWRPIAQHARTLDGTAAQDLQRIAALYYADRFGGRPLSDDELREAQRLARSLGRHDALP